MAKNNPQDAPIVAAIVADDTKTVARLLAEGVDPNATNVSSTPLLLACERASLATVDVLLQGGAEIVAAPNGRHPIASVIQKYHTGKLSSLLAHGGDPNARNHNNVLVLCDALWRKRTAMVRMLLDAGASVNGVPGTHATPLETACSISYEEGVRLLLARGADPNHGTGGRIPLTPHGAVSLPVVKLMVDAGADVNACAPNDSPLMNATTAHNVDVMEFLVRSGACIDGTVQNMTPFHADICAFNPDDDWDLLLRQLDAARLLLTLGCDACAVCSDDVLGCGLTPDMTPLEYAVSVLGDPPLEWLVAEFVVEPVGAW